MNSAELTDRALVRIDGEVATEFLQNLITCDVEKLVEGEATFGALLMPQGKILFDFFCVKTGTGYLFDISESLTADFIKRMTFYKLRTPVEIAAADDSLKVFAAWNNSDKFDLDDIDIEDGFAFIDPRLTAMGARIFSSVFEASAGLNDYNGHRIARGMPAGGGDYAFGEAFPHDAMMDQFENEGTGVAFSKGCYVGQEVVSRMQHRGTARRRIIIIKAEQALPEPGTPIDADGKAIGTIGSTNESQGLAMMRLDRLSKAIAAGNPISADGIALTAQLPQWSSLSLHDDASS